MIRLGYYQFLGWPGGTPEEGFGNERFKGSKVVFRSHIFLILYCKEM